MAGRTQDLEESVEVACRRLAQAGTDGPPAQVPDGPGTVRAVIEAVRRRIGAPASYGAAVHGPYVRWSLEGRVLLLSRTAGGLRLSVCAARGSAEADRRAFHADPHATDFARLPYLWQVQAHGPPQWPPPASVPAATDWLTLEASLAALLRSCAAHVPQILPPGGHLGFDLTTDTGRGRAVAIASGTGEGVSVLVDDRSPAGPTPPEEMYRRGWDRPLAGWWEHAVLEADEAPAAAGLLVHELRLGGAKTPTAVRATDMSSNLGHLLLPGLAVHRG